MNHDDFRSYVDVCRQRGLSDHQVATMLGCGVNSVVRWKRYDPPYYIGLAIAALEKGLNPWKKP